MSRARVDRHRESLNDVLRRRAEEMPDTGYTFLLDGEVSAAALGFGELERRARAIAAALQATGAAGGRAVLLYPPGLDYIAAFFGCLYAGVVAVPAYPPDPGRLRRTLPRLRGIVADSEAAWVLTTAPILGLAEAFFDQAPELRAPRWLATDALPPGQEAAWREHWPDADELAFLQYTSGSTGSPRGVMLTHANLIENLGQIAHAFGVRSDSLGVSWLPPYHDMGLIGGILGPLYGGCATLLMSPLAFLQRPLRWLQAISSHRATISGGPNFAYDLCVRKIAPDERKELDLSCWELAFSGAEPIRAETLDRFTAAFEVSGFRRQSFYPCYGLAEATLLVSGRDKARPLVVEGFDAAMLGQGLAASHAEPGASSARLLVGCGSTLRDQSLITVNPASHVRCNASEVGEIWVRSRSVARGYWKQPEETTRAFGARPAGSDDGPYLRTGDLGFLRDGELFVTGRLKDLIIVRGRNHYPQDIEATVERSHPTVRRGCTAAFSMDIGGQERLVVVAEVERPSPTAPSGSAEAARSDAVRTAVSGRDAPLSSPPDSSEAVCAAIRFTVLEHHDLHVHEVILLQPGTIAKTSSGKIQRHACRASVLDRTIDAVASSVVASDHETTKSLATLGGVIDLGVAPEDRRKLLESFLKGRVARVLRTPTSTVDLDKPVNRFGLDSLMAIELTHALEKQIGVVLPLTSFLREITLRQLAGHILDQLATAGVDEPEVVSATATGDEYPLSHGQDALWFLHRLDPESAAYNVFFALRMRGPVGHALLERCLQQLSDRHAALRSTCSQPGSRPFQTVHRDQRIDFAVIEAAGLGDAELRRAVSDEVHRPFTLERGSLLRARLFRFGDEEHVFAVAAHHVAADLWSLVVLLNELSALYPALAGGRRPSLPRAHLQYRDYVSWQQDAVTGREGDRCWAYWRKKLGADPPQLELPTDRPRPAVARHCGAAHRVEISVELTAKVRALAMAEGATTFTVLLAAFQAFLGRTSGQEDFVIGSPVAGRSRAGFERVVGYFVNPLVLRADLTGDPTFATLLARTRQTVLEALEHESYPFPTLVERLHPQRVSGRTPIFQVLFVLEKPHLDQEQPLSLMVLGQAGMQARLGALSLESFPLEHRVSQFDLALVMVDAGQTMSASFQYDTDLFDTATIERMAERFLVLVEAAVTEPARQLSRVPILTEVERRVLVGEWNATHRSIPDEGVHTLFEARARSTPDAVAVLDRGREVSYRELDLRADRVAARLRALDVAPEAIVAVALERSVDLVAAMLGVLKAGCAYLPLDPAYPRQRLEFMVEDAGASVVVTAAHLRDVVPTSAAHTLLVGEVGSGEPPPMVGPGARVAAEQLAYVMYTSGSTGRPKGAQITHRGVVNMALAEIEGLGLRQGSRQLQFAAASFDASAWEIFGALLSGATLCLETNEAMRGGPPLLEVLRERAVTTVTLPPSLLTALTPAELPALTTLVCAGEACSADVVARWKVPGRRVINAYGPTEVTVCATMGECAVDGLLPSLGRPLPNVRVYLLDRNLVPVPMGTPAEIYVGGAGVARGYHRRPDLTAERFVPDPLGSEPGARLYRTGDIGRFRADGALEYIRRADDQVKMRGFRIELGEVEAALRRHPAIREAVVVIHAEAADHGRMVAYVVPGSLPEPVASDLRLHLQLDLPEHMLPSAFVTLAELPRTPSGKLDRAALPRLVPSAAGGQVAPTDAAEEALAAIWREVLRVEDVGTHANFFELGGDSILAIQVVSRAHEMGLSIRVQDFYRQPTIAGVLAGDGAGRVAAEQGLVTGAVPLTPIQRWFFELESPRPAHWNQSVLLELTRPIDVETLGRALSGIALHHDGLRARFSRSADAWQQVIEGAEAGSVPIERVDLTDVPTSALAAAIEVAGRRLQTSLDLHHGPLLRAALFDLGPGRASRLLLVAHHLVVDAVSWRILVSDLALASAAIERGVSVHLPPKTTSFAQWARGLVERADDAELGRELSFWVSQSGGPWRRLPVDSTAGDDDLEASSRSLEAALDAEQTRRLLRDVPVAYRTRIDEVLLTALAQVLSAWTGSPSVYVELESHGRVTPDEGVDLSRTVGWFTALFPVRLDVGGLEGLTRLRAVRDQLRHVANRGIGYGILRHLSRQGPAALAGLARPEVSFNYLGQLDAEESDRSPFRLASEPAGPMRSGEARRPHRLEVLARVSGGRLVVTWTYSEPRHTPQTIARLSNEFLDALRVLISHCDSLDAGPYTPADFPEAELTQDELDAVIAEVERHGESGE